MIDVKGFGAAGPIGSGDVVVRENPARPHEMVARLVTTTPREVDHVVTDAVEAQRGWAQRTVSERAELVSAAADQLDEIAAQVGAVLAAELGKPIADSEGECRFAAGFSRFVAGRVEALCAERDIDDERGRRVILNEPLGTIAAIVPWNAPLILASLKVAPAVACGNAIVVKPSPLAPAAVTIALQHWAEALPPGVISVVHGERDAGEALVQHRGIRKVAFTGGEVAGSAVLHSAADALIPATMELGGNDAAVVLPECTFTDDMLSRMVFGVFLTSGQVCMAAKRIYVHRDRLHEFQSRFVQRCHELLVWGDPTDPTVTVGPVVSSTQRDALTQLRERSTPACDRIIEVGRPARGEPLDAGYFVTPAVAVDADPQCELVVREQFGPLVPIVAYHAVDEAIELANSSPYGLASSVWADDEAAAFAVGRQLDAGTTFINCHNRAGMAFDLPFGGRRRSGFGLEFGDAGIASYLQTHVVHAPASTRGGGSGASSGRDYPTAN